MTNFRYTGMMGAAIILMFLLGILLYAVIRSEDDDLLEASPTPPFETLAVTETTSTPLSPSPTFVATTASQAQGVAPQSVAPTSAFGASGASTNVAVAPTAAVVAQTDCIIRTDLPAYTVQNGDTLSGIAERSGSTIDELAAYNCILNTDRLLVGQVLYVTNIPSALPTTDNTVLLVCDVDWFFAFDAGQADVLNACPEPVLTLSAVGQNFENGRVIVYAAPPITPEERGVMYVVYNDGTWEVFTDTWEATEPVEDSSIVPPAGYLQPTEAIGKIWRENVAVQQKLGWAIEPPIPFEGHVQLPAVAADYFYLDHGVDGYVLRMFSMLDTTGVAAQTWELVGQYVTVNPAAS